MSRSPSCRMQFDVYALGRPMDEAILYACLCVIFEDGSIWMICLLHSLLRTSFISISTTATWQTSKYVLLRLTLTWRSFI